MASAFSVCFFDTEENWHEIVIPAPLNGDHFPWLKEQVCARLGVADTQMFWEDDQNDVRSITCSKSLATAIQDSLIHAEKDSLSEAWLTIFTSAPPTLINADWTSDAQKCSTLVHEGITCDGCDTHEFTGLRYKCLRCLDYDLCHECYTADRFELADQVHTREHPMKCIDNADNDGSTHSFTVVACVYCDAKGLSTAECYEHVKKYHKNQMKEDNDNADCSLKKVIAEMWEELKQRKELLDEKEKEFEERKRAVDEKERMVGAREDVVKNKIILLETALKTRELDLKEREKLVRDREDAVTGKEEALAAREALVVKMVEDAEAFKQEMKSGKVARVDKADENEAVLEKEEKEEEAKNSMMAEMVIVNDVVNQNDSKNDDVVDTVEEQNEAGYDSDSSYENIDVVAAYENVDAVFEPGYELE